MAADNPIWGEERIANELKLKLGIRVSPRTVGKYLRDGPVRAPDPKQRWLTFVHHHAKVIVACDFFVMATATFRSLYCIRDHGTGNTTNSAPERDRSPDRRVDLAAVPRGAAGRSSVSVRGPRPGQHLLQRVGPAGD
jgi:hypothetical protein